MKTNFRVALFLAMAVLAVVGSLLHSAHTAFYCAAAALGAFSLERVIPGRLCVTLTVTELLTDVIGAFTKNFPALNKMGTDFRPDSLKLGQQYIAHIPSIPTVESVTNGDYSTLTGNSARSLLTDVPITVDKHKAVKLYWNHINAIQDQKNKYDEVINLAGYALAKAVIDDLFSGVTAQNFSQFSTFAVADSDVDMLNNICADGNAVGMMPQGRTLFVNSDVATVLGADSRLTSRDYAGQQQGGNALRSWVNTNGFSLIQEYADFPSNNGTTFTITGVAATDVITTNAAHGLAVGDVITIPTVTGGAGITASATTRLYVKTVPSSTTLTVSATAGGATLDFTTAITDGTLKATENLTGFEFDMRAFSLIAGVPEDFNQEFLNGLNIPRVMGFETVTDPVSGITMAAVGWQEAGTGKLIWAPTLVWGKALGRQGYGNAAGSKADYAGHRLISA